MHHAWLHAFRKERVIETLASRKISFKKGGLLNAIFPFTLLTRKKEKTRFLTTEKGVFLLYSFFFFF